MRAVIIKPDGEKVRLLDTPDAVASFSLRFKGGEEITVVEPQPPLPAGSTANAADWRFVLVRNDGATLEGWVAGRFVGELPPIEPAPLLESIFIRACVRTELAGKLDATKPQVPADYLIAWSLMVSDMTNPLGNPAFRNAGGPFLMDDNDWADFAAGRPEGGGAPANDRLIPASHAEPASFIANRDMKAFQAVRFPAADDPVPLPTFVNVFHTRLFGAAAAAEIERRLQAEAGGDQISAILDASVPALERAMREERAKEYLQNGDKPETVAGFAQKTSIALAASLAHAFELMQKYYPEYFVATPPDDEEAVEGGAEIVIHVTVEDLDALARVGQSEVGHFTRYGNDQFIGGLAGVVDTVINRTAHRDFPSSIQAVINQPSQFSAINKLKSWTKLPAARPDVFNVVKTHIDARLQREAPAIKGSTHFLNPNRSSQKALQSWGNYVVANAIAIYGSVLQGDVHYHGSAPGTGLPRSYALVREGSRAEFSGSGKPLVEAVAGRQRSAARRGNGCQF